MKNYFKFNLTGNKLFPVWLAFMVLFLIPYIYVQVNLQSLKTQDPTEILSNMGNMMLWYGFMIVLLLIEFAIMFYLSKMSIEGLEYKEEKFLFSGTFGQYLGILITGFLLSIITLGIYSPWLCAKILRFFSSNTAYKTDTFQFKGKGGDLFVIILVCVIIPMFVVGMGVGMISFAAAMGGSMDPTSTTIASITSVIMMVVMLIVLIPYMYYIYKWMVNFKFKDYQIAWKKDFWNAAGKIALEMFLIVITIGIYSPLAMLKLYKYFAKLTVAKSETSTKTFDYDIEPGPDFLYLWGQMLLTMITLGIYYPWAYCNIGSRIINKTSVVEVSA